MIHIPLSAVPSQTLAITLNGQATRIALRYNQGSLYFDLYLGSTTIMIGKICRNLQRLLIAEKYQGFLGDFIFVDTQGDQQPNYSELDSRYFLYYLYPNE